MTNRVDISGPQKEIKAFINQLGVNTQLKIAKKMSVPVLYVARALAPVGTQENPRYRGRARKGTRNKRPKIWQRTLPGNLRRSHDAQPNGRKYRVGPHVKAPPKEFAFYAWAHHKLNNPWLKRAENQSRKQAETIGIQEIETLIRNKRL